MFKEGFLELLLKNERKTNDAKKYSTGAFLVQRNFFTPEGYEKTFWFNIKKLKKSPTVPKNSQKGTV